MEAQWFCLIYPDGIGAWGVLLGVLDVIGAFSIFALMIETTKHASWRAFFRGDRQSGWAFVRRLIYAFVSVSLFAKAVFIAWPQAGTPGLEALSSLAILFAIVFFPAMRALRLVDQDQWIGLSRGAWRRREHDFRG